MLFDSLMLARLVADLRHAAVGARVERVFSPAPTEVVLDLARRLPRPQITLAWAAENTRVHLSRDQEPRPDLHPAFTDVLRRHLRGATVTAVGQLGFDRVLWLDFANAGGLGPGSRMRLLAEIMGRRSNVILTDPRDEVVACAHSVTRDMNRVRETLPGSPYVPPPLFDRLDPHDLTPEPLLALAAQAPGTPPLKLLGGAMQGASDALLALLRQRLELPPGAPAEAWAQPVATALARLLEEAEAPGPGYLYPAGALPGVARGPAAYLLPLPCEVAPQVTADLSAALEQVVTATAAAGALGSRRAVVLGAAERGLRKASARVAERERALAEAEGADELRRRGELILANLHAIGPGAAEVQVVDYYAPEQPSLTLALDPRRSAQEQAAALFGRYKKARRTLDRVPPLLEQARAECEYLGDVVAQAQAAQLPADLEPLEHELVQQDLLKAPRTRRGAPRRTPREPGREPLPGGYTALYGRTGSENDALLRAASGDDLWFHVKSGPGGHVVVRASGNQEPAEETLEAAAALAAGLSRWRSDTRAEVAVTRVRHVRKPPGAPPGFVTYTDFRTLVVIPRAPGGAART
jgi:predicted ribosome quality control (RQC) complex YloA/Tae2 family protein